MAVVLALCSAVVYGVSDYCGGRATRRSSAILVTLVAEVATLLAIGVVVAVLADPFPPASDVAWGLASGAATTVGVVALYHALANAAMTVVAPVTAVVAAAIPVVVGLATGERPGAIALVGVALAVVAIALVSGAVGTPHTATPRPILLVAVLAGAGFGLLFVFLDRTSEDSGAWPLLIARWFSLPAVAVLALVRRRELQGLTRTTVVLGIAVGILTTVANTAFLAATRRGLLSVVAVVVSLYPASTVLLATVLDGERVRRPQAIGLGLAAGALVLVTLGR